MSLLFETHDIKNLYTVTLCTYWSVGRRLCVVFTYYIDNCYVFLHSKRSRNANNLAGAA